MKRLKIEVFKQTSDDWYPNYIVGDGRLQLVRVNILELYEEKSWRVCVWGNDDCGMEKDFINDELTSWRAFAEVISLDDVTKDALTKMGFVQA